MGHLCFVTLFPEIIRAALGCSILGRAVTDGLIRVDFVQIRDFSHDKHHRVDDAPYGGGPGLVMKAEPLVRASEEARRLCAGGHVVLMSPQGRTLAPSTARRLSENGKGLIFVCGHYEGIDERVRAYVDEEISIGDFVLTGGELAAAVVSDSVSRLWPGVLGNAASSEDESFSEGWLEYPQYTRPEIFRGERVPEVLLRGDHGAVAKWRRCQSILRTRERRPELFEARRDFISHEERVWLGWESPRPKHRKHHKNKVEPLEKVTPSASDILPAQENPIDKTPQ